MVSNRCARRFGPCARDRARVCRAFVLGAFGGRWPVRGHDRRWSDCPERVNTSRIFCYSVSDFPAPCAAACLVDPRKKSGIVSPAIQKTLTRADTSRRLWVGPHGGPDRADGRRPCGAIRLRVASECGPDADRAPANRRGRTLPKDHRLPPAPARPAATGPLRTLLRPQAASAPPRGCVIAAASDTGRAHPPPARRAAWAGRRR